MAGAIPFTIGVAASCTDGICGRVTQIVLDPITDKVTHLIVEPEHRQGLGRFVPIDWAEARADQVDLRCTQAEFDELQKAEEIQLLPGTEGYGGYQPNQFFMWPYFGASTTEPLVVETLPIGEVSVQRGETVHAGDGPIGEVEGLVIDRQSHHVTHVLLKEGHLFGHRDVAIPISAVQEVDADGVQLSMTKGEVEHLPAVDVQAPFS